VGDSEPRFTLWIAQGVVVGVVLGLVASVSDTAWLTWNLPGFSRILMALVKVASNTAAGWVGLALIVGLLAAHPRRGAVTAAFMLLSADVTYYVVTYLHGPRRGSGALLLPALAWGLAAVVVGACAGAAGPYVLRRHSRWAILSASLVGGTILGSPVSDLVLTATRLRPPGILGVQVAMDVIAFVVGIGVATGWPIGRRRRLAALAAAFVVALGIAAYSALQVRS